MTKDTGPFYDVTQFSDIPWPGITQHTFHGLIRDYGNLFAKLFPIKFQKVVGHQWDTNDPLSQGRKLNFNDFKTVVKIFPEFPLFHHFLEVDVGGGYDSDIDLYWFILAHRSKSFFL